MMMMVIDDNVGVCWNSVLSDHVLSTPTNPCDVAAQVRPCVAKRYVGCALNLRRVWWFVVCCAVPSGDESLRVQGCAFVAWALQQAEPAKAAKMAEVVATICGFLGDAELRSLAGRRNGTTLSFHQSIRHQS
jgi:hypothetical protein